eukprot:TRINITY_DN9891_c0_g2_i1.p1 TRINITY_DN9891_c0_g2~~TRINITY_DN9891_c0_g2_i1.p1  ORF type:complete len:332 (+),score=60.10 TRINITY_DN9891_c0_g2_i1:178-1173(+)
MPFVTEKAAYTVTGTTHGGVNQDSHVLFEGKMEPFGTVIIAAVFDGHSPGGERAAQTAAEELVDTFMQACRGQGALVECWQHLLSAPDQFTKQLFQHLHERIVAQYADWPAEYSYFQGAQEHRFAREDSEQWGQLLHRQDGHVAPLDYGCTASVAVFVQEGADVKMVAGNCGDSPIAIAKCNQPDTDDGLKLTYISRRHTLRLDAESSRVKAHNLNRATVTHDHYLSVNEPMLRGHQVQISRSLGHKQLQQYGITWEPDTLVRTLNSEEVFAVVVVSDGVTDSLRRADVLDILASTTTAEDAAQQLAADSHARSVSQASRSDDCTAVVVCL